MTERQTDKPVVSFNKKTAKTLNNVFLRAKCFQIIYIEAIVKDLHARKIRNRPTPFLYAFCFYKRIQQDTKTDEYANCDKPRIGLQYDKHNAYV